MRGHWFAREGVQGLEPVVSYPFVFPFDFRDVLDDFFTQTDPRIILVVRFIAEVALVPIYIDFGRLNHRGISRCFRRRVLREPNRSLLLLVPTLVPCRPLVQCRLPTLRELYRGQYIPVIFGSE